MVLHGERQPRGDIAEPAPVWEGPAPGPVTTALTWRLRYRRFGPKRRPFRGVEQGRFSRLTAIGQNPVEAKSLHSDGGRLRLLNGPDRSVPAPIRKTAGGREEAGQPVRIISRRLPRLPECKVIRLLRGEPCARRCPDGFRFAKTLRRPVAFSSRSIATAISSSGGEVVLGGAVSVCNGRRQFSGSTCAVGRGTARRSPGRWAGFRAGSESACATGGSNPATRRRGPRGSRRCSPPGALPAQSRGQRTAEMARWEFEHPTITSPWPSTPEAPEIVPEAPAIEWDWTEGFGC